MRIPRPRLRSRLHPPVLVPLLAVALLLGVVSPSAAQPAVDQMSIEDLMNLDVTSVSRRSQPLADTSAAVFVLTSEDIRRSGAPNIPELLRLVPGVHVARIDANKWSVSVRGFTGRFAPKLLVLVDGRSVYAPLFSGVVWDTVNVPLDTIERIEVIRGPGATLWGANAVNGVINIITRSAAASSGVRVTASAGNVERGRFAVSLAGAATSRTSVRVDAEASRVDTLVDAAMHPDPVRNTHVAFRTDTKLSEHSDLLVQAGYTGVHLDDQWDYPSLLPPFTERVIGASLHDDGFASVQWTGRGGGGETIVHGIVQRTQMRETWVDERRWTLDLDLQRTQRVGSHHELVMGGLYRQSSDRMLGSSLIRFEPEDRTTYLGSLFAQDELALFGNRFRLTAGAKAEHNSYTGWEIQPNVRASASLTARQSVWGAVSRAVRLPSRVEADGTYWLRTIVPPAVGLPVTLNLTGLGDNASAEVLNAFEGGYRYRVGNTASIDVSVFENLYSRLRSNGEPVFSPLTFAPVPHLDLTIPLAFGESTRRHGVEVAGEWRPHPRVRLSGSTSWLGGFVPAQTTLPGMPVGDDPPSHLAVVRAALSLPARVDVDGTVRYVSRLPETGVPAYVTADARVGFKVRAVNLSVVGRNLASPSQQEFIPEWLGNGVAAAERSILIQAVISR